ncbi:MAG: hypothetical protein HRT90_03225 [Candidatus Margulisbacteria bacterium]|nr:hypothetical protein [Candidatus Margulisiibacteriota bacterium]
MIQSGLRNVGAKRLSTLGWVLLMTSLFLIGALPGYSKTYEIETQNDFDSFNGNTFNPGDQILFKKGAVFSGKFTALGKGVQNNPIVLSTYGEGPKPIINGGGVEFGALDLIDVSFFEADGLELTNTDGSSNDQGTLLGLFVHNDKYADHIQLKNFSIHDVNGDIICPPEDLKACKGRGGIYVLGGVIDNLLIQGNTLNKVGGTGIENQGEGRWKNFHVIDNFVSNAGRNAYIGRHSQGAVVEYNVAANSSTHSTGHSFYNYSTDDHITQFNESYGNTDPEEIDRGGFDADYDATGTIIQYNYSHDNNWFCGIMKKGRNEGVTIRYNISQNEQVKLYHYGFNSESDLKDVKVYNNTHYTKKGINLTLGKGRNPINTVFENNIFYFEDDAKWGSSFANRINTTFNNNWYYGVEPVPDDISAHTGDPMLVDPGNGLTNINMRSPVSLSGYMLQPGSAAIGTGNFIQNNGGRDFWGNPVNSNSVDMGAVQRVPEPEYDNPANVIELIASRNGQIASLAWDDNFTVTTGYVIQFSGSIDYGFRTIGVVPAGTRQYTDNINCGGEYCFYRIQAVNANNGRSSWFSNIAQAIGGTSVKKSDKAERLVGVNTKKGILSMAISLSRSTYVKASLYNFTGKLVAVVFEGELSQGSQQITWAHWNSLTRGVYQLNLRSGNWKENIRLNKD